MQIHNDIRFQALIERMEALHIEGRTDEMKLLLEELQTLAEAEQDDIGLSAAYFYRDLLFWMDPGSEYYMQYVKRALIIAQAKNIPYYEMKASNSLGISYSELSDFHSSLEHYLRAIQIAEEHPEFCYAGVVLNNVGNLFVWLEEYSEATVYLERAYYKCVAENENDRQLIELVTLNLIELYSNLEDYDKVREWEQKGQTVLVEDTQNIIECINLVNRAKQLVRAGQGDEAAEILREFSKRPAADSDYIYILRCCIDALRLGIKIYDFALCSALMKKMEQMQEHAVMTSFSYDYATVRVEYYQAFRQHLKKGCHAYYADYYRESQSRILQLRNTYARSLSVKIALEEAKDENKNVHLRNEQLQRDNERDIFTHLYNKVSTEKHVGAALHDRLANTMQGFMLIDVDLFKRINDFYGHSFGDKVLISVADAILSLEEENKIAGRFGGDEFLVFLDHQDSIDRIRISAEALLESVRKGIKLPDDRVSEITLSIGVCVIASPAEFEEVFLQADAALYRAKELGRNRFELCEFNQ